MARESTLRPPLNALGLTNFPAKNPDILTYVCGLEFATLGLSGHSITQMLARGKHALAALGEDLQAVSKLMATSFVQMAANLASQGDPLRMSSQSY